MEQVDAVPPNELAEAQRAVGREEFDRAVPLIEGRGNGRDILGFAIRRSPEVSRWAPSTWQGSSG
jgi:hypothetical protein